MNFVKIESSFVDYIMTGVGVVLVGIWGGWGWGCGVKWYIPCQHVWPLGGGGRVQGGGGVGVGDETRL